MPWFTALALLTVPPANLDRFVLIQPGTVPVVLSAPHGGRLSLPGVPPRKGEGVAQFTTVRDVNTDRLAEKFAAAVEKKMGGRPYLVIARFSRKQIDVNRPPERAYESDLAKPYYDAYHDALRSHCEAVRASWGRGLVIDIHGQGAKADTIFRGTARQTSVALLKERFGWNAVAGPDSLLGAMAAKGHTVYPSPSGPADAAENPQFGGGYITRTYGAAGKHGLDAVQLEFGGAYTGTAKLDRTANDLAESLARFTKAYLPERK